MSEQDILTKAIQKGVDGGWKPYKRRKGESIGDYRDGVIFNVSQWIEHDGHHPFQYIFNHDFAKALWGEGKTVYRAEVFESPTEGEAGFDEYLDAWEYHLQQMVVAEDPIKYLGDNLPD